MRKNTQKLREKIVKWRRQQQKNRDDRSNMQKMRMHVHEDEQVRGRVS